jgi:hypothetical protein
MGEVGLRAPPSTAPKLSALLIRTVAAASADHRSRPATGGSCGRGTHPAASSASDPIPDLLKAVNEASGKAFALWITFLTVATYLAIAIGTTTHLQLPDRWQRQTLLP